MSGVLVMLVAAALAAALWLALTPSVRRRRRLALARTTFTDEQRRWLATHAPICSRAPEELREYSSFDYVIFNDEIERATRQLASIIYAERARCMRQEGLVREVMSEFNSNQIIES